MSALVILGAGSSYDSVAPHSVNLRFVGNEDKQPPLADHLFDSRPIFAELLDQIPHLGAVVPLLRSQIARGIALEDELARLADDAEKRPRAAQQLSGEVLPPTGDAHVRRWMGEPGQ